MNYYQMEPIDVAIYTLERIARENEARKIYPDEARALLAALKKEENDGKL